MVQVVSRTAWGRRGVVHWRARVGVTRLRRRCCAWWAKFLELFLPAFTASKLGNHALVSMHILPLSHGINDTKHCDYSKYSMHSDA